MSNDLERNGRVVVLGAGFTKAFANAAPLLSDAFPLTPLRRKYRAFPHIRAILDDAYVNPAHVNIERLLTRLSDHLPYDDFRIKSAQDLAYKDVVRLLTERIEAALSTDVAGEAICKFAESLESYGCYIITFNYDDLLERALSVVIARKGYTNGYFWNPTWGYGFHATSAESAVTGRQWLFHDIMTRQIYKLHGSLNWRVVYGTPRPVPVTSIVTWQSWCRDMQFPDPVMDARISAHLELEPFILPPILSKTQLLAEPVARFVWSAAYDALRQAKEITFVGYSLPQTDIASSFLFRESTRGLAPASIRVVDYFDAAKRHTGEFLNHSRKVMENYRSVFPKLKNNQFNFDGAFAWVESICRDYPPTSTAHLTTKNDPAVLPHPPRS